MSEVNKDAISAHVLAWVDAVVIANDFCPFAQFVRTPNRIRIVVCPSAKDTDILECVETELAYLDKHPECATTLIALPLGLNEFNTYLNLLYTAEQLLSISGYEGIYQLASFHPDYVFAGEAKDAASNYTNRSPYPLFHLLREEDISQALSSYPDAELIPQQNIAKAESLGCPHLQASLANCLKPKA
jgi:hypothetical protein